MSHNNDQRLSEDETSDESSMKWINFIFLPFNPIFKFIVLITVIVKCILGPMTSVHNLMHCDQIMDDDVLLSYIKAFYIYFADPIYCVNTFLHIVHRQVEDEARKREYLPKSAFMLLLDILSLMPLFSLAGKELCHNAKVWPNILSFNEMLIIYQVVQYFSLHVTHSLWRLTTGYIIITGLVLNAIICFFLLLTYQGLCEKCNTHSYDWRSLVSQRYNTTTLKHFYFYASLFVMSFTFHTLTDHTEAENAAEYVIFIALMIFGYFLWNNVFLPRFFTEGLLRYKRIFTFRPRVVRIIEETKRRSPSHSAYKELQYFYSILWRKRLGICSMPDILFVLPKYLQKNIRQDLVWAVFYHSPVFRKTSTAYKRWLSEYISMEFKLPGERFFTGSNCFSNLYYIKSGVVQIYSEDDCTSPILSVTGGTIFGDCSFIIPPVNRKLIVRCFTYCEVLVVSRTAILTSLHKFPEDRRIIMKEVRGKIKHARGLFKCKQLTRGLDRSEDEGIAWLKKRWWEISAAIARYKRTKREHKCELPSEETNYHCAKYIGQLVLGKEEQLRKTTMFVNITFPYLLAPYTTFGYIWNFIIYIMVWLTIIIFPPNMTNAVIGNEQIWFVQFRTFINVLYILDIVVSLITTIEGEENLNTFSEIIKYRFKNIYFFLDLLSSAIVDQICHLILPHKYLYILDFNDLLKTYMLFVNRYELSWHKKRDPVKNLLYKIALVHVVCMYVFPFALYTLSIAVPEVSVKHFLLTTCKTRYNLETCKNEYGIFSIVVGFNSFAYFIQKGWYSLYRTAIDIILGLLFVVGNYMICIYSRTTYLAGLYMKNRHMVSYQYYVQHLKKFFLEHKLHPDLMNRLERHLTCHWKYYKGMDLLYSSPLQDEPYDIYWRYQGEIAEKVISESNGFKGADPGFIKELVHKSKFLILPKNSTLVLFGLQIRTIMWLINGSVKCEYHNDENELQKKFYSPVKLLSFSSMFLDRAPLRTFIAESDCEILYIPHKDYVSVLNNYPDEKGYFEKCCKEIRPRYDECLRASLTQHSTYQRKLRDKILHGKKSSSIYAARRRIMGTDKQRSILCQFFYDYRTQPESRFIIYWMQFRVIVAMASIVCAIVPGVLGVLTPTLNVLGITFEIIGLIDMVIKLFLPYYDERGLIISSKMKCVKHYLIRGFIMDLIANVDVCRTIAAYIDKNDESLVILFRVLLKSTQIYLFMGYLDYKSDMPTAHSTILMIFAQSLSFVQFAFSRMTYGIWEVVVGDILVMGSVFILIGLIFWFCFCMCQIISVLHYHGDTIFQQSLTHLKSFLKSERVESHIIKRVLGHFEYWWVRTKGVKVQQLLTERIGVVFRQDLNYYFYKKTLGGVDSLLSGGEALQRTLVAYVTQLYYLSGQDVVREHDLVTYVFFVHRGKVSILHGGKKLADITKGSIFGQLDGKKPRPIRITALTAENTDLLMINVQDFQQNITEKIRRNISNNPESKHDYMAVKQLIVDDPEATIEYMLRKKVIKFPRIMKAPIEVETKDWYFCWAILSSYIGPVITAFLVVMYDVVDNNTSFFIIFTILDCLYVCYLIPEFYSMKLIAMDNKCVYKHKWLKKFCNVWFYVDILSLSLPVAAYWTGNWKYNLARLARIHTTLKFYKHNCNTVRTKVLTPVVKISLIILLMHILSCIWVSIICRRGYADSNLPEYSKEYYGKFRNYELWISPRVRNGCTRLISVDVKGIYKKAFLVPNNWVVDYLMAFYTMTTLLTSTNSVVILPFCTLSTYMKVVFNMILSLLNLYICSLAVSNFYTKYREKLHYDYKVSSLLLCLKYNGLSKSLLTSVQDYTDKSWKRQKGLSLPPIIQEAPLCMQQDIMSTLYMHHLRTPPLFANLPNFFLRQLVTRLNRVVVFPEKPLVREGDIFPRIYFIHEGEVEKWYLDETGEARMGTVLNTNGYFGLIPALFPNTPYQFSYYSRTVVDMVYLDFNNWQDLLDGYPDIKRQIYMEARQAKLNVRKLTITNMN